MRNRGYVKKGFRIDVQIRDEYFVTANINPANDDKTEFKCDLSIHDKESGMSIEIDKTATLSSKYKTVNKDVTQKLNYLIDNGYFDDDVTNLESMLNCLNALLDFQRRLMSE